MGVGCHRSLPPGQLVNGALLNVAASALSSALSPVYPDDMHGGAFERRYATRQGSVAG